MAELTKLESKVGEVLGLAQAAQAATRTVMKLSKGEDEALVEGLRRMREEAAETERRCKELAGAYEGKKTAILAEAKATKQKASEMMGTYLDEEADALDGFEFLVMAEAGEVGHWAVLEQLCQAAGDTSAGRLVEWALPIQERHFAEARNGSLRLAAEEDPHEAA